MTDEHDTTDTPDDESDSRMDGNDVVSDPDLDDVVLDNLDAGTEEDSGEASRGLFDDLLEGEPIFENKEVLRPSYTPHKLPHREEQINNIATILVTALRGDTPSNILIYGKTGTGKTASAKFVSEELETTSQKYEVPCEVEYINCEVTDTQYRVLAQLANKFINKNLTVIEDQLTELEDLRSRAREDETELDGSQYASIDEIDTEIDSLEADTEEFEEVPMTGWPTDRVYSSFFDAVDYHERVVVIMLDEIDKLVEKSGDDTLYNLSRMNSELKNSRVSIMGISNDAQEKIELDRVVEVVRTLPTQSKIVLFAIILLEKNGVHNINTGEVFNIYKNLCAEIDADVLTQRRVTDLISELDMLGIVNAVVVSKGRYGRTKEISLSVPTDETEAVLLSDSRLGDIDDVQPFIQARFDN